MSEGALRVRARRRVSGPLVTHVAVALAVCLLVATVALQPVPSAPPATAAISPDAARQIEDAPVEQTAEAGGGGADQADAAPGGSSTTSTTALAPGSTPTTAPGGVPAGARVRRCVANGDGTARQTEDPQSPPCVAFSAATTETNGGATTRGVTKDRVRIAVPSFISAQLRAAYEAHFNDRYELHGRRIELVPFDAPYYTDGPSQADLTAAAVRVADELQAFAATGLSVGGSGEVPFYAELARRKVISLTSYTTQLSSADLNASSPYLWSALPAYDELLRLKADWYCRSLAGRTASFAQGQPATQTRRLGFVYATLPDGSTPDLRPVLERLRSCESEPAITIAVPWNASFGSAAGYATPSDLSRNVVLRLRSADVTTVYNESGPVFEGSMWSAASTSLWHPEWLLTSLSYVASSWIQYHPARDQFSGTLVLAGANRELPPTADPGVQQVLFADPTLAPSGIDAYHYRSLLILVAGIQAAGPNLTPQTFAAALEKVRWNPRILGVAPTYQAQVGFGPAVRSWSHGASIGWYDGSAAAPANGAPGAICFLDGGKRYAQGAFPATGDGLHGACA